MKIELRCKTATNDGTTVPYGEVVEVGKDGEQIEKARAEDMVKDRHALVVNEKVLLSDKELKARIAELTAEVNRLNGVIAENKPVDVKGMGWPELKQLASELGVFDPKMKRPEVEAAVLAK